MRATTKNNNNNRGPPVVRHHHGELGEVRRQHHQVAGHAIRRLEPGVQPVEQYRTVGRRRAGTGGARVPDATPLAPRTAAPRAQTKTEAFKHRCAVPHGRTGGWAGVIWGPARGFFGTPGWGGLGGPILGGSILGPKNFWRNKKKPRLRRQTHSVRPPFRVGASLPEEQKGQTALPSCFFKTLSGYRIQGTGG